MGCCLTGLVPLRFEGEVVVLGPPNTKEEFNSTGVGVFELREEGLCGRLPHSTGHYLADARISE